MSPEQKSRSRILIRGGTVIDERASRRADVLVEQGVISAVEESIEPSGKVVEIDARGCYVTPGLVDLHTHLREPGGERAETIETGARAASLGGYTAILAMPNTLPAIDSAAVVRDVLDIARGVSAQVLVSGAITKGRLGEELAEIGAMAELGVCLFTDDGTGVQDAGLMRRALEYASDLGVVLAQHCEDSSIACGGHMNEGEWSSRLGIHAQPALAEEAMVARDLSLVELTGAPMHFLHLSAAGSIARVREAKAKGLPVTAEATPHHLCLTDSLISSYDPVFKVNPPLRSDDDVLAVKAGIADRTIDAIATDHAPHPPETKQRPFDQAPFGMLGLETALAVAYGELVESDGPWALSVEQLFALFCWQPARICRADKDGQGGPIASGNAAHLCVFDPSERWTVDPNRSASRSRNTPFAGRALHGRVRHTVYAGELVVEDGVALR
jgi:dihydroorotase